MDHQGVDWATAATAIATVCAFLAAGVAVIYAKQASDKVIKLESDRDKESKRLEEIDQAAQISGWVASHPEIEEYSEFSHTPSVVAIVSNPSQQPIYNVIVIWKYKGESQFIDRAHMIRPNGGYQSFPIQSNLLSKLKANRYELNIEIFSGSIRYVQAQRMFQDASGRIQIDHKYPPWIAKVVAEEMTKQFDLIFSFTDIRGVKWQRDEKGILDKSSTDQGS